MIQKLKTKFIIINMFLVSIVLLGTFLTIGISTHQKLVNQSNIALEVVLMWPYDEGMPKKKLEPLDKQYCL
jgi:hypothetical protein